MAFAGSVVVAAPAIALSGTTLSVTGTADTTGPCTLNGSSGTCPALRSAVDYADQNPSTSVVIVLPGGYYPLEKRLGTLDVTTPSALTISGAGASSTVVEGGGSAGLDTTLVSVSSGADVTLSELTLSGGASSRGGGDLYNDGTLAVSDATVTDGYSSDDGGAVYNDSSGVLTLGLGTVVSDSQAPGGDGGGVYNAAGGSVTVGGATLRDDTAQYGGAVYNAGDLIVGSGSSFTGDSALTEEAGAIDNDAGVVS
ncbi:MAG TPA: hypothetical protein VEJ21_02450, partial [Acidimicrobiales bacterium]|nr:hypothetical protein [Acidimicrobiales bacterium]